MHRVVRRAARRSQENSASAPQPVSWVVGRADDEISRRSYLETLRQSCENILDLHATRQQALFGSVTQGKTDCRFQRRAAEDQRIAAVAVRCRADVLRFPEHAHQFTNHIRTLLREL